MKNILIADNRPETIETLELILKHWGYRVLTSTKVEQVSTFLKESQPSLLIIGAGLLSDESLEITAEIRDRVDTGKMAIIELQQECKGEAKLPPNESIAIPVDLFELFSFIQRQVEKHPRHNIRLRLRLPGMYSIEDEVFILADVLSLSTEGLFFKAPTKVSKGDRVTVVFPLFGHCKEIEVESTVLYTVDPDISNNFSQGFGVSFGDIPQELREQLQQYIREHFLREVSSSQDGVSEFSAGQLK